MNAQEFVDIDNAVETGESLTDETIIEIVSDSRECDIESDDDDVDDKPISKVEARHGLESAISYFENNPEIGKEHLPSLWRALRSIDCFTSATTIQRSIMDFIRKK
ncbi:hypothetical protein KUTeg_022297 [Tegillarca granosa]|uniref:Uncharacterized protein n=1 Tax=Tegillarca granosa TaxID=220873 RepID=A0ABQ9EC06_TEGGR|nr:hypothetical protein KUTeg_022297 [Tegillarca granosa]